MCDAPSQGRMFAEDGSCVREDHGPANREDHVSAFARPATDYWIAPGYRPGQREALERVDAAFLGGSRYVIVEAPTGLGKSHIARALAYKFGYAYILTVDKGLQSQYQVDFPDMYVVKGRSAYACREGGTCEHGPCRIKKSGPLHTDCPYQRVLSEAMQRPVIIHNFDSFYYQSLRTDFGYRELMVIDEAHNIPTKFLSFMEIVISNRRDKTLRIPKYAKAAEYDGFLAVYLRESEAALEVMQQCTDKSVKEIMQEINRLNNVIGRLRNYFLYRDRGIEYVVGYDDDGRGVQVLTIRPVMVGDFVNKYLLKKAKRVLMMSATILDKRLFCSLTGIRESECAFIRLGSSFPPENRPVYLRYAGKMSSSRISKDDPRSHQTVTLPVMADRIKKILDHYPDSRGIIQTHTTYIMDYLHRVLTDPRLTYRSDYATADEVLAAHAAKPGSFLVAAGMREGIDLRDDLSRVQVICKIPFPDMRDARVKRLMELDRLWSSYMTSLAFVQMLGRSVRSETDYARTYVLDADFMTFWNLGGKYFVPGYIKAALVWPREKNL